MQNEEKVTLLKNVMSEIGFEEEVQSGILMLTVDKAITVIMKNRHHVYEYEDMPSDKLKCYELLTWVNSVYYGNKVIIKMLTAIKEAFAVEDWQWLIDNTPNITAKICWSKILKEKQKQEKQ